MDLVKKAKEFYSSRSKLVIVIILTVLFITGFRSIFMIFMLGMLVMATDFLIHSARIPIHLDLLLFASLLITRIYGLKTSLVFSIITGNIPEMATGSFNISDALSVLPIMLLNVLSTLLISWNLVLLGVVLSVIFFVSEVLIAMVSAAPVHKVFLEPFIVLLLNIFLFINFGEFLAGFM